MLGEQIAEGRGKLTVLRVLPSEGGDRRVEVSFQAAGKILSRCSKEWCTLLERPCGSAEDGRC